MKQPSRKILGFVCKLSNLINFNLNSKINLAKDINVEIIELDCLGKLDEILILESFNQGADAVFIAGCPEDECFNINGSSSAKKAVNRTKKLLKDIGFEQERLSFYSLSGIKGESLTSIIYKTSTILEKLPENKLKNLEKGVDK
ncbi:hydrogenase iron-sulfur subunit [Selenomonadales bacterium OttesenSCG-928-I06]|nr:hydrogenase iron-sulfur subunit [Selenomonadales bacterium OttesenSCG-928-I06]